MQIRVAGVGIVTLEELEARFTAYLNAGAPKPEIEGSPEQRREILRRVANRGDSQMKALISTYLEQDPPG